MTTQEAIMAFKTGIPIIHNHVGNETEYTKISALIYRIRKGCMEMTVELLDNNRNCVTIALLREVRKKE